MERWASWASIPLNNQVLLQTPENKKTSTRSRHLPQRKYLYKHPSALYIVPRTATNGDVNTNVKWRNWNALYPHAELGGASPGSPWIGVTVGITCNKGEHFTNDWRTPEQQHVKEAVLCSPQAISLSLLTVSPGVYKPVSVGSDALQQAGKEDTAQKLL